MTEQQTNVAETTGGDAAATQAEAEPQNPQTQNADNSQTEQQATEPPQQPDADPQTDTSGDDQQPEPAFELNAPEGLNLNDGTIAKLKEVAQDQGLTAQQTQALLDAAGVSLGENNEAFLKDTREEWVQAVANDKELGGHRLNENMALADKVVETFGDEGLRELLNEGDLPLGKEPRIFRLLVKVGKAMSDDRSVNTGNNGKPAEQTIHGDVFQNTDRAVNVMYPDQQK